MDDAAGAVQVRQGPSDPLSKDAVTLLADLPRWRKGDYIFSTREGRIPINRFGEAKQHLDVFIAKRLGASQRLRSSTILEEL